MKYKKLKNYQSQIYNIRAKKNEVNVALSISINPFNAIQNVYIM